MVLVSNIGGEDEEVMKRGPGIECAGEPRGRLPTVRCHGKFCRGYLDFWGEREQRWETAHRPRDSNSFREGQERPAVGAALLRAIAGQD